MATHKTHMSYPFYFKPDGTRDPVTELLDCLSCPLYFDASMRHGEIANPYAIFLTDPALHVVPVGNGGFASINIANRRPLDHAFQFDLSVPNPWTISLEILESRLDEGCMLIVHTHASVIPCLTAYDPSDSLLPYFGAGSSHLFLIVGHDADSYFYVDMPSLSNGASFIEHPHNPRIGVAPKEMMYPAFMRQLDFCHATAREDFFRSYDSDRECISFLENMLETRTTTDLMGQGIAEVVAFLETRDLTKHELSSKQVVDTAYSMFFLALEVIYKYKIMAAALAHSPTGLFDRHFSSTMAALNHLISAWWPVSELVSPFSKPEVDLTQGRRLAENLRQVGAAEAALLVELGREYQAWQIADRASEAGLPLIRRLPDVVER